MLPSPVVSMRLISIANPPPSRGAYPVARRGTGRVWSSRTSVLVIPSGSKMRSFENAASDLPLTAFTTWPSRK